jgi:hypothetical protein
MKVIEVTEEDIIKGVPNHKCKCPIALAIKRAGFENNEVYVGKKYLMIEHYRQELPKEAQDFVKLFDGFMGGQLVEPFQFKIFCDSKIY